MVLHWANDDCALCLCASCPSSSSSERVYWVWAALWALYAVNFGQSVDRGLVASHMIPEVGGQRFRYFPFSYIKFANARFYHSLKVRL